MHRNTIKINNLLYTIKMHVSTVPLKAEQKSSLRKMTKTKQIFTKLLKNECCVQI